VLGGISGDIGAARRFRFTVVFSPQGVRITRRCQDFADPEKDLPFSVCRSLKARRTLYCPATPQDKFSSNLNGMRT
jgi:hypothetical protein